MDRTLQADVYVIVLSTTKMNTTSLLAVTVIAGTILLVTGTSIEMAFAQNPFAPGQFSKQENPHTSGNP